MLKLVLFFVFGVSNVYSQGFTCPTTPTTIATLTGNLPTGATNLTVVPAGTNCTFAFDIPNNYAILLSFSVDFQSDDDFVYIYDNNDRHKYYLVHSGNVYYDAPLVMPARSAKVQVVSVSGNTTFFMSYTYQSLSNYQQVTKNTGEYFPLSNITGNYYYTITASGVTDQVVPSYAQRAGVSYLDPYLHDIFVYDGDNINTATFLGGLDELGSSLTVSSGRSLTLVNLYGTTPSAYFLGNDAATVQGLSRYFVILATSQSIISGSLADITDFGAAYTFICIDCSTYFWTQMQFDSSVTVSNKGYISFQGQTPTHKREKLIKYDPMSYTQSYLPQTLPTDIFTINLFQSRVMFNVTTSSTVGQWNIPYDGRKGFIFAPSLWTSSGNSFSYDFRDDSQLYNYSLSMDKMTFPVNTDVMFLKIGSASGVPAVDNQYPRDQNGNNVVSAVGNSMQVTLVASTGADVRLSFSMAQAAAPTTTTTTTTSVTPMPTTVRIVTTLAPPPVMTTTPVVVTTSPVMASSTPSLVSSTVTLTTNTPTSTIQTTTSGAFNKFFEFIIVAVSLFSLVLNF